jgi:hypothetical protein
LNTTINSEINELFKDNGFKNQQTTKKRYRIYF